VNSKCETLYSLPNNTIIGDDTDEKVCKSGYKIPRLNICATGPMLKEDLPIGSSKKQKCEYIKIAENYSLEVEGMDSTCGFNETGTSMCPLKQGDY
jgi:hypothetical protein